MSVLKHPILLRLRRLSVGVLLLLVVGQLMRPVEESAWKIVRAGQPELNLGEIEGALGQGLVVGVLGGFRTILADLLWIRMNSIWERRDRIKLDAMIRLIGTLDPRPDFFWINSARMVAYDVPHWRVLEEGGYTVVLGERQQAIGLEQAEQAFAILERARSLHPNNPKLYLETGQIYLNRLNDYENAAIWFLKASELPRAPYYAARVYGELLRRQGKQVEAYRYLQDLYTNLPNDPYAQKNIILGRIRELETTLKIPYLLRYQSAKGYEASKVEAESAQDDLEERSR
jgi:tetratricopeptide (TPR) repeat protein